jgi:hypothetical protein
MLACPEKRQRMIDGQQDHPGAQLKRLRISLQIGSQRPQRSSAGLVAVLHLNSSASRRVLMLQLQRTLHGSTSVSPGYLTNSPSWPSMPSQERWNRPEYFYLAADLCQNQPSIQLERCPVPAVSLLRLWRPGHTCQQCPQHNRSIPQVVQKFKRCGRPFLPSAQARGLLARPC